MIELIGTAASILFFISGLDQLYKTVKDGNANGLSLTCLIQIIAAYGLSFLYLFLKHGLMDKPFLLQYTGSATVWGIILYYKIYPRGQK